jgi:hypothetical protein
MNFTPQSHQLTIGPQNQTYPPPESAKVRRDAQLFVPQISSPHASQPDTQAITKQVTDFISKLLEIRSAEIARRSSRQSVIETVTESSKQPVGNKDPQEQENSDASKLMVHTRRQIEEDKKTDHAKVKDDDQKEANGKPIDAAKAPAELLVEESKKEGEVHGGCMERAMAKPIA